MVSTTGLIIYLPVVRNQSKLNDATTIGTVVFGEGFNPNGNIFVSGKLYRTMVTRENLENAMDYICAVKGTTPILRICSYFNRILPLYFEGATGRRISDGQYKVLEIVESQVCAINCTR